MQTKLELINRILSLENKPVWMPLKNCVSMVGLLMGHYMALLYVRHS